MLYLLDKDVRTVRWNGEPLHEATSAIVKETINGDFILTVKYPISDTGIYKQIKEDMLIKCPTPVLGPQLFRIKKPVEENDYLEITAYHITDDIMQRSVKPVQVANQTCSIALSQMVQNAKTDLGDFSFTSDIQDRRTFNMSETENIYSVLLDGKHSIVGTWEGELVRDNFSLTVKKNRGENRGVVITTHKNLKSYQRSKNSQNVITRIHARSTFKPEGSENETTIKVTVDSPLINSYPYINEREYENNNLKSVEDLKKWAQAKFTNEGIDKVSDSIKLEAYELDGQVVNLGDTVNLKSLKHNVDIFKKAIAYEYDGLKEEYLSLEFDDKPSFGGSGVSNGLSNVANTILGATYSAQEFALERAARNADLAFEHQSNQLKKEVEDGIELIKAKSEENKRALSDEINRKFHDFSPEGFEEAKAKAEEALKKAGTSSDLAEQVKGLVDTTKQSLDEFKSKAFTSFVLNSEFSGILSSSQTELKRSIKEETDESVRQRFELLTRDNEAKLAEYKQGIDGRITDIASQVAGKVNQVDFQRVKETSQLYERILGGAENDISRNVSRLVMSDQVFQTEVGNYVINDNNLIVNSETLDKSTTSKLKEGVSIVNNNGVFTIDINGLTNAYWGGFTLPIYVPKILKGETYTLGFKYRILRQLDHDFRVTIKNHSKNKSILQKTVENADSPASSEWKEFQGTFTMTEDFEFGTDAHYPLFFYLVKNGHVEVKEPMLVRGVRTGSFKPSQFDDAYKTTDEAKGLATDAQARAIQIAQGLDATRTQVTQLAGSYAIQNLNSAGDIINGINLGANGNNRIIGKATHITGDTLIDNAVIKSAMIDKLKTANFEAGSVTTTILGAEAVTAEKVKFDTAFIQKLVSQQAFINELFAKQATINRIQSIDFTGNNIKGGKISSLNGVTDFDLQTGWIEMNKEGVGIVNHFVGRPIQYLVFGAGAISNKPGSYTALMSNSNGRISMDDGSAGIQIWNTNDNTTAVNLYGDEIAMMYNANDPKGIIFDNINNEIRNVETMRAGTVLASQTIWIKGTNLVQLFDLIDKNFAGIEAHFKRNKLGSPGRYGIRI